MRTLVLSYFILFIFASTVHAQNNAVTFDGIDDYVDCSNNALFDANTIRTMECWVKFNSLAGVQEILSKSANSSGIELLLIGNTLAFYCMNSSTNGSSVTYPTSNLAVGRWYHIAAAWDGTKESMQLIVNGVVVPVTRSNLGNINPIGLTNPGTFRIGQWSDAENRALKGTVDEVRIWSVTRTAAEIKKSMYGVNAATTGLVAYYKMNEASGPILNSTANAGLSGTLTNGASLTTSPVQYTSNALDLDGSTDIATGDYVIAPGNAAYNIPSGTVEFMVKPNAFTAAVNHCIMGVRGGASTKFSFHITASTIVFFNGAYYTLSTAFAPGTWYHLAFVCDGINTLCYKDGVLIGTFPAAFGPSNTQTLVIGRVIDNIGNYEAFNGAIDEVRIWNTQRTATEINNNKSVALTGNETGLVALYSFNQGISSGANTGLLTAVDGSATNNNGTLMNMALTGVNSNYVANAMVDLPVVYSNFTVTTQNGQALLQWQTEQETNSAKFIVQRSTDGSSYETIGEVNAAGNSAIKINYAFADRSPANGKNYYRLNQVDLDGKSEYSKVLTAEFTASHRLRWYATGKNTVEIRLHDGSNERYKLLDVKGSILQTGYLRNGRARFNGLTSGTYVVQVQSSGVMTTQFVVQ